MLSLSSGTTHRWPHSSRIHMVPYGFVWPNGYAVNTMWNLWYFGDSARSIGAYRHICPKYDLTKKDCKTRRARCRGVMWKLETIAIADQKMSRCRDVTFENSQAIFLHAFEKLVTQLYTTPRRPEDLVTCSVYDRLSTKGMLVVRRTKNEERDDSDDDWT